MVTRFCQDERTRLSKHRAHRSLIGEMPHRLGVRRAGLFLLVLGLLLAGTIVFLTRPKRLASLAGNFLTELTGAQADIKQAWIRLDGTLELQDVTLSVPGMAQEHGKLFEVKTIVIRHHILSLLQGRFEARNLTFIRPVLYLTQDVDTNWFNYQSLQTIRQAQSTVDGAQTMANLPSTLPNIFIRSGELKLGELRNGNYHALSQSHFNGSFSSDAGHRNLYYFSLRQTEHEENLSPFLAGNLNISTLAVEVNLKGLAFDDMTMQNLMPPQIKQWWEQLAPTGNLPSVRVGYDPDPKVGLFGVLDVSHVALTLPYTESKSRMTVQSGQFRVAGQKIVIENLIGQIEGFTYKINGTVDGLHPDAPFKLTSKITGKITKLPRYAPWFGKQVHKAFEDLSPSGELEVNVLVNRKETAGPFSYQGLIDIRNATISYASFPYPLTGVRGLIRFDDNQIKLENFRGKGPSGTQLSINCQINLPTSDDPGVKAQISGLNLPIDDYLYNAMGAKDKALLEKIFSRRHYAVLSDEQTGILASSDQHKHWQEQRLTVSAKLRQSKPLSDQQIKFAKLELQTLEQKLTRPVFDLGGKTNMILTLKRDLGKDAKNTIDVRYELRGVNVLLEGWAYPMKLASGVFTLGPEGGKVDDVLMQGLNGGEAVIHGSMYWAMIQGNKKLLPEIKFTGTNFPVDNLSIHSLGHRAKKILTSLGIDATVDAVGIVRANEMGKPYPTLQIHVRKGSVTPFGGRYTIDQLQGYIAVHDRDVQITQVSGRHKDAIFSLTGVIPKDKPVDLFLIGEGLTLDSPVLDLIPPPASKREDILRVIEPWHLAGVFDLDMRFFSQGRGTPWRSELKIAPQWLTATIRDQPITLNDITGDIDILDDGFRFEQLNCRYGTGEATLKGEARFGKGQTPKVSLVFDAKNQQLCQVTRALLPLSVTRVLDALEFDGQYHLQQASLNYHPKANKQESTFDFKGKIHMLDARAVLGMPLTQIKGDLDLSVSHMDPTRYPQLKMILDIQELYAADRLISPLRVHMDNIAADGKILFIQQLSGHCYNGLLHGHGQVSLTQNPDYMFRLTLQDADYEPFIDPDVTLPLEVVTDTLKRATLSADLTISGTEGKNQSQRTGRGSIAIRNASIYRFPLIMSIVQLLNLTTPTAKQFNDAEIEFLMDGDIVNIEHIQLHSPTINITGKGSMKYSDLSLDLNMFTGNPGVVDLGPVTELLKMFKNEMMGIHVGGTLKEPITTVKSLGGIRQTMLDILGKKKTQSKGKASAKTSGQ